MNKEPKKAAVKSEPIPDSEIQNIEELEITTASTWKKDNLNIRKLLLPSGAVFRVKNVSLANLAMKAYLSLPLLTSLIAKSEEAKKSKKKEADIAKDMKPEEMQGLDEIVNKVTLAAVIEPILSVNGDNGSICVDDIDFNDKMTIFQECVRGGAGAFAGFPE